MQEQATEEHNDIVEQVLVADAMEIAPEIPDPEPEPSDDELPIEELSQGSTHETLLQINHKMQNTLNLRQENNFLALKEVYNELLPYLLDLRRLNRCEKIDLENRQKRVKELNERLTNLQLTCNSLAYEVATTNSEVDGVKSKQSKTVKRSENSMEVTPAETNGTSHFDANSVALLDHSTRMKLLDEEEKRRKRLREKLLKVGEETKSIEIASSQGDAQLDQVRPYIKQLLEKVAPTLQTLSNEENP